MDLSSTTFTTFDIKNYSSICYLKNMKLMFCGERGFCLLNDNNLTCRINDVVKLIYAQMQEIKKERPLVFSERETIKEALYYIDNWLEQRENTKKNLTVIKNIQNFLRSAAGQLCFKRDKALSEMRAEAPLATLPQELFYDIVLKFPGNEIGKIFCLNKEITNHMKGLLWLSKEDAIKNWLPYLPPEKLETRMLYKHILTSLQVLQSNLQKNNLVSLKVNSEEGVTQQRIDLQVQAVKNENTGALSLIINITKWTWENKSKINPEKEAALKEALEHHNSKILARTWNS